MKANAKNVRTLAQRKEDQNYDLRRYFKEQGELSEKEVDQLVSETTRHVWASFDCARCANCCKELTRTVTDEEAGRLAARLALTPEEFRRRYLQGQADPEEAGNDEEQDDVRWRMRGKPCPFLKDNRCTVYEDRPEQCRKYPYLYEPRFSFRTLAMIERTFTCPVVYQVFEELKAELPFSRRSRNGWQ